VGRGVSLTHDKKEEKKYKQAAGQHVGREIDGWERETLGVKGKGRKDPNEIYGGKKKRPVD